MTNLQIEISIAAIVLLILITICLAKNRMSIRNSIAWFILPIIFLIIAIFPEPIEALSKWLGFEIFSNFLFVVIIGLLILIIFFLTVSLSREQDQITKLNQEISILKMKSPKNHKSSK